MIDTDFEIEECSHEPPTPYTIVPNALIRDESISPACRWLIIYLISNTAGWKIKASQIINHLKGIPGYGRDNVYKILKEAIDAGYMMRQEWTVNNLKRFKY